MEQIALQECEQITDEQTNKQNESKLLHQILKALSRFGYAIRTNAGSVKLPNGKRFHAMPKGFSDLLFLGANGRAAFIEIKLPGAKATEQQAAFLERMQSLGYRAGIAHSVEEALNIAVY